MPAELAFAIEKALARDPAARFRDGLALAAALEGKGTTARRAPRLLVAGLGLAVLGGLGAARRARARPAPPAPPSPPPTRRDPAPVVSRGPNPEALKVLRRAVEKMGKNDNDGALADANRAIELDPKLEKAWVIRGTLRQRTDEPGAIADFERAVALDPKDGLVWGTLATIYHDHKEYDRALAAATKAIEAGDPLPGGYQVRAESRKRRGDSKGAIEDFTAALALDPKHTPALIGRGYARKATGDLVGARADLERFIELAPNDPDAAGARKVLSELERTSGDIPSRAETLLDADDLDAAIAAATAELELAPDSARALHARGIAYAKKGERTKALADLDRAIGLDANRAESWAARASVHLELGDSPKARDQATHAMSLKPALVQPWVTRAVAKEMLGDVPGAIEDFEHALGLLPAGSNAEWVKGRLAKLRER